MKIARATVLTLILLVTFATACGQGVDVGKYSSISSPIIGGIQVADGRWPAVGAIALVNDSMCTGTLVSPKIVVTAAHCIVDDDWWRFTLGFDMANGTDYEVEQAVAHRDYDPGNNTNQNPGSHDVGVLVLKYAVTNITPARLFSGTFTSLNNKDITFVGYGLNDDQSVEEYYGLKYEVTLKIADITATGFWNYTSPDDPHNTCGGDSGGPGFVADGDGGYVIAGFVSSGDENCQYDGFNMRADDNADWIAEMIQTYDPDYVMVVCDNGKCEEGENEANCPQDCVDTPDNYTHDTVQVDLIDVEDTHDTGTVDNGGAGGDIVGVDMSGSDEGLDSSVTCTTDCRDAGVLCGDNVCEANETCQSCPQDCGQCVGQDVMGDVISGDVTVDTSSGCTAGTSPYSASGVFVMLILCGVALRAGRSRRRA